MAALISISGFSLGVRGAQTLAPAGTLLNSPHNYTWNRMTTINVSSGQIVPLALYQFNTFSAPAGSYTLSMTTVGFPGAINLYQNYFDPTTPNANFWANGVVASGPGTVSQTLTLPANSLFEVVFSASTNGSSGTFGATISGPGNVTITTNSTVSIRVAPKDTTISSGSTASLQVFAIGPLPQTWQWYGGAVGNTSIPISGATKPTFVTAPLINNTSFWVRVTGPGAAGSQDAGANITVTGNPNANYSGSLAPGGCTLTNGNLYAVQRFQIQSQGNYVFNITSGFSLTTYEGVFDPLHPAQNLWGILNGYYAAGTYDLVISKAIPGGAFSGAIGGGPAIVNLVAPLPPEFLSSPLDTTITPGQTTTLSVSTTCGTPFSLQWYNGNSGDTSAPISGATGFSYKTPALFANTNYWVRMTYSGGHSDSGSATVFVTTGPITDSGVLTACDRAFNRPEAAGILSGSNCFYKAFVFRVATDGAYTFSIQTTGFQARAFVYQNGFDPANPLVNFYALSPSGGNPLTMSPTLPSGLGVWYLVISSQNTADTGSYGVTVTSGPALVTRTPSPVITTQPANTNIFRNQTATLSVVSPSSGVSYQWYTGADCGSKVAIAGANSNSITTPPLVARTSYWVELTTPGGYLFSSQATVGIIPQITNVTSTASDGAYRAGQVIPISIAFDRGVTVSGTPQLSLNSGGAAAYASGTGTATLTLNYTVGAGQTSEHLDFTSTNSLSLSGGTIAGLGVPASLVLPVPGAAGSLGANKNILIDTTPPSIVVSAPSATSTISGPVTYTVTYSDAHFNASTLAAGNVTLNKTGDANGSIAVSGSGTTRNVVVSNVTGNGTLGISIAAGTATDTAGNATPATAPSATFTAINAIPFSVTGITLVSNGGFQFSFTNVAGAKFHILTSSNLLLPLSNWSVVGDASEGAPGHFQFASSPPGNGAPHYYRVLSP
jgi:hypothetical protein